MKHLSSINIVMILILTLIIEVKPVFSYSGTAKQIDTAIDAALNRFVKTVKGAKEYLEAGKGVLIIPEVKQAGFIVGGEYGEGGLRINGKTIAYYNIVSGSIGYQLGAQQKDIILIFIDETALKKFRESENWQAGLDGTVTLINAGVEGSVDSSKLNQPIIGFVSGQKGLMAGATIESSKFSRLNK